MGVLQKKCSHDTDDDSPRWGLTRWELVDWIGIGITNGSAGVVVTSH